MPKTKERPQSAAAGERALTIEEVTALLNRWGVQVSRFTVRRDVQAGRIPSFRIGSRTWVFESELMAHVRQQTRPEPEPAA